MQPQKDVVRKPSDLRCRLKKALVEVGAANISLYAQYGIADEALSELWATVI